MTRAHLFNRRDAERFEVEHEGISFLITIGRYADGSPGEVFTHMQAKRLSSPFEALTRDASILISLCLQFGAPLETLRKAVTRDEAERPASVVGAILDALEKKA